MRHIQACVATGVVLWVVPAIAVDVGDVGGQPVQLEVTETSIVEKHFSARTPPGQPPPEAGPLRDAIEESDWGGWINRLNTRLRWEHWDVGLRLDSAVYLFRPADEGLPAGLSPDKVMVYPAQISKDNESRFKNSIYPAKLWATYSEPGLEVTAGDAYVQFGRGLTLSMRKVDELGIDTTVRGGKVQFSRDPFSVTVVAGFANPSRVDEATGRALWVTSDLNQGDQATPQFGSDRLVGVDLQAGRGLPVTFSTHFVRFSRCAPYHFDANENPETSFGSDPGPVLFGTCDASDTDLWLHQSLNSVPVGLQAHDIVMAGQSIEVPSLWGHGTFYAEAAIQQRQNDRSEPTNFNGNALYAALSYDIGKTSSTFELKSNRNFYTVTASAGQQAPEFAIVAYTFLPPAESFNMLDAEGTGAFNACVEGGRLREDVNLSPDLLVYAQGVFAYSLTENSSGGCDSAGRTISGGLPAASVQDVVWDGVSGLEYSFDDRLSHVFASAGGRHDSTRDGTLQYGEGHVEYSVAKYLGGPWSLEVQGRHRHRWEADLNISLTTHAQSWWTEGENYVALRMAPKWVFSSGFEYTTLAGQPTTYVNGSVLYKFTSGSNLRLFVGQQRGAFRCASGMCRFFPAFEGARAELTLRF